MSSFLTGDELRTVAFDVVEKLEDIISDRIKPYDSDIQKWAVNNSDRLDPDGGLLRDAVMFALSHILMCDNEQWDPTISEFKRILDELTKLLKTE